jgi:hypothetical protein
LVGGGGDGEMSMDGNAKKISVWVIILVQKDGRG